MKSTLALPLLLSAAAMLPLASHADGVRTGEQVVLSQCVLCHGRGIGGAPRIGDGKAWGKRAGAGIERLVRSATDGRNGMPPSGGLAGLDEAELRAAILYMLDKSGVSKN